MLENYVPILVFILVGIVFGVAPITLGKLLGPSHPWPSQGTKRCGHIHKQRSSTVSEAACTLQKWTNPSLPTSVSREDFR